MVRLSKVEIDVLSHFRGDGTKTALMQPRLGVFKQTLRFCESCLGVRVDGRAVLGSSIVALTHPLGGVVAFKEIAQYFCHCLRLAHDPYYLCVTR